MSLSLVADYNSDASQSPPDSPAPPVTKRGSSTSGQASAIAKPDATAHDQAARSGGARAAPEHQRACLDNGVQKPKTRNKRRKSPRQRPDEFQRELSRGGFDMCDVQFVDVDASAEAAKATEADVPHGALLSKARRIASRSGVSREEKRRHQITALAADAAALRAAQRSMGVPDAALRRR